MNQELSKAQILRTLFFSNLKLSTFTFGGGFVIVSLMKKTYVEKLHWLEEDEMLDITAISQSSPGPIIVNASVILGYRMGGILGSIAAILGSILPPLVIISLISVFYTQFRENKIIAVALQVMRAGVAAVIFDVVISLTKNVFKAHRALYILEMAAALAAVVFFDANAMVVILSCLFIGFADLLFSLHRKGGNGSACDH